MTTDATGNPIGSTDARDRFDNTQNLDYLVLGPLDYYDDRIGVPRLSYRGIENQANTALANTGFVDIGDYDADGPLTITQRNQVFTHGGQFYGPSAALVLPYTTIGNWVADGSKFVNRGDFVLRQDLGKPTGATEIGALDSEGLSSTVQAVLDALKRGGAYVRNVKDDFGAIGDGIANDTAAIQAAVNWAASTGAYIRVPAGIYKLTAPINIPNSFKMVGEGFDTSYRRTMGAQTRYGSYFYIAHTGKGFVQTTATTGQANTNCLTFRDFATIRDQPTPTNSSFAPTNHDWDFYITGYGACEIDNVCALNATRAFYVEQRAVLNNLKGQAFASFIEIHNNYDVVHINNCHQWPYWNETSWAMDYTRANLVSYAFYRADNALLSNNFSYAHRYGLLMGIREGGVPSRLKSSGLDLDGGAYGIVNTAPGSTAMFDNTSCTSWNGVATGNGVFSSAVGGTMEFRGLMLSNIPEQGIYVEGNNNRVKVVDLWLEGWNKRNTSKPGIACVAPAQFHSGNEIRALKSSGNNADILSGTGVFRVPLGKGLAGSVTSNPSGLVVVTHGLIAKPWQIFLTLYDRGTIAVRIQAYNETTFTVELFNPATGAPVPNRLFAFSWSADYYLPIDAGV